MPTCARYLNCKNQVINVTIGLVDELFKESYLMIENVENQSVQIETTLSLELSSDNSWFFWGVGLTCLLLISLVIFVGIIFYWILKYKRVKKMFEQFKLTEENIGKED